MIEDKIPVKILGQDFDILGNSSETLYYNSLARYVEDKMREIMQGTNIVSSQKIAVLAALNITDELFRDRDNKSSSGKSVDKRHEELIHVLNRALDESSGQEKRKVASEPVEELSLPETAVSTR